MIFRLILLLALCCLPLSAYPDEEDVLLPVFPNGYLSDFKEDRSVFISGSRGTYIGSSDEDGNFIALGGRRLGSAFGKINEDGSVMIFYSPVDSE